MNEYLKAFIIGSSWPVFISFFYTVSKYPTTMKKFSYDHYTFVAPLFLGFLNAFGLFLAKRYNWTRMQRFLITSIIGATWVALIITLFKVYNFSTINRWIWQYFSLYVAYLFIFGIIVNFLDSAITTQNLSN